jgi:hypothetical protein
MVVNLDPVRIHVPRELAPALPLWDAARPAGREPPFTLSVRYGRYWEPWVVDAGR